jgi:FAD synthase
VALGKFDAMHRGHAALASRAAEMGAPVLMRFGGMAEVLGWTPSLPVVAPSDRARVLEEWTRDGAVRSGDAPVREHVMPFAAIRRMSPEQFVRTLAEDVGVRGVVAGRNYRFGFKAAGDADALIALGAKLGVEVAIVDLVEATPRSDDDDAREKRSEGEEEPPGGDRAGSIIPEEAKKRGRSVVTPPQVSSTLIRAKLAEGDVRAAASLLGRPHRLVLARKGDEEGDRAAGASGLMTFSLEDAMNQYPAAGAYEGRTARGTRVRVEVDRRGVRVRAAEGGDEAATRLVEETDGEAFVAVDLIDTSRGGDGGK